MKIHRNRQRELDRSWNIPSFAFTSPICSTRQEVSDEHRQKLRDLSIDLQGRLLLHTHLRRLFPCFRGH